MSQTNTPFANKPAHEDVSHQIISSYFIGPQAENLEYFKTNIATILQELELARTRYHPQDGKFISDEVKSTDGFKKSMERLNRSVQKAANILGRTSIPFWSPRYEAHMCTDMSMASLLGYFMTMIYNPNNVAIEASPVSTVAEIEVGEQLCELFGYNTDPEKLYSPTGWGHVTCDGTVANLESIWVARNLKFYPLALRQAITGKNKISTTTGTGAVEAQDERPPLEFLASRFYINTCEGGEPKLFSKLSTWELLNLKPTDILEIPDRLYQEHAISNAFLSAEMNKLSIQSVGKDKLERNFDLDLEKPCLYMLSNTRHYSWPKGAAICGLGSDCVVGIPVDHAARIDIEALEKKLEECLEKKQPILAVVAILGSTEEGAVDSLSSILAIRKQFQARGLSFLVHADAAWGGYFCTMLPQDYRPGDVVNLPTEMGDKDGFVPDASLRAETQEDLYAMRFADSITVDPHKAGYIPYPAGGLCYRDGRMRFLVTWNSPYLSRGSVTSIGIYGVEGSKPGASAVSTWLSNKIIGLNPKGYGSLLGEVTWTCTRLSAEWAALSDKNTPFICVPFNKLPSEMTPGFNSDGMSHVECEKQWIREHILNKINADIMKDDKERPDSEKAIKLLRDLGSDLNINAFSLNFRYSDGRVNDDIEEANYLMQRVVGRLSVESPGDDPTKIPLYLTSTEFSNELYGECKREFERRLGLQHSDRNLMVLRNVVMSPFPTDRNFIGKLVSEFRRTVEEETKYVLQQNEISQDFHKFLMQGTEAIYLVHMAMFHVANHRQQTILAVELDERSKERYVQMKKSNPTEPMILITQHKTVLLNIIEKKGCFKAQVMTQDSGIILKDVLVQLTKTIVSRPLNSRWRLPKYPRNGMPFYLYGKPNPTGNTGDYVEANIDHVIVRAPNTQLSSGRCKLDLRGGTSNAAFWEQDLVLLLPDVHEASMQPFPPNAEIGSKNGAIIAHEHFSSSYSIRGVHTSEMRSGLQHGSGFFFQPGAEFNVSIHVDKTRGSEEEEVSASYELGECVGRGTLTLGDSVFVDSEAINFDPYKKKDKVSEWRREFDEIAKEMDSVTVGN